MPELRAALVATPPQFPSKPSQQQEAATGKKRGRTLQQEVAGLPVAALEALLEPFSTTLLKATDQAMLTRVRYECACMCVRVHVCLFWCVCENGCARMCGRLYARACVVLCVCAQASGIFCINLFEQQWIAAFILSNEHMYGWQGSAFLPPFLHHAHGAPPSELQATGKAPWRLQAYATDLLIYCKIFCEGFRASSRFTGATKHWPPLECCKTKGIAAAFIHPKLWAHHPFKSNFTSMIVLELLDLLF